MPGISHFSREEIADRFAAVIRAQEKTIERLRGSMRSVVELIEEHPEDERDDVTEQVLHILKSAIEEANAE